MDVAAGAQHRALVCQEAAVNGHGQGLVALVSKQPP